MMSPKKSVPKDTAGESQTPSDRLLFGENNPPAAETDRLCDEVLLSLVEGVGSLTITRLLECFGTAKDILSAKRELLLTVPGIGDKTADQILSVRSRHDPEKLIERCRQEGIAILTRDDPRYPRSLLEIADPPFILYAMGERLPQDDLAVAVVGTRGCSLYGRRQTETLVRGLTCAGVTIVSGLALGIDGVAHEAALRAGGRTIAVLGSGLLNIYPACHKQLAERIAKQGVLYSEFPPLTTPIAGNFPRRNRIVSGLTLGVLVVETARRGGSLITARLAMEQN
ncbi:MAG: DNA-processing protein DprA, partial [Thermoguttaceae bacterium]|nr:DNA-processing protein DprA [Thermoguttaceae bacterium]